VEHTIGSKYLNDNKSKIEESMQNITSALKSPERLKSAMNYSLQAGGKRLRPILLLATLHAFQKDEKIGIPIACALEMIHTYSLIHDDLPSMDDDDLRRGKPTNHKVYGEAIAILAGDGLLTYSFQVIAEMNFPNVSAEMKLNLINELAKAAGPEGMVAGQVADMEAEGKNLTMDELEYVHLHKTGKLLSFPIIAGAILANAANDQQAYLKQFAKHLGIAFQIKDDILDIEGTEEKLGKPVGSDTVNHKATYPALLSMEGAKEKLDFHITEAKEYLKLVNFNGEILEAICDLIASRDY
jgi:geranylgeranyl diphosphate synthase type II